MAKAEGLASRLPYASWNGGTPRATDPSSFDNTDPIDGQPPVGMLRFERPVRHCTASCPPVAPTCGGGLSGVLPPCGAPASRDFFLIGRLSAFGAAKALPLAAAINNKKGLVRTAQVIVPVGVNGKVSVYNANGSTEPFLVQPAGTAIMGGAYEGEFFDFAPGTAVYTAPDGTPIQSGEAVYPLTSIWIAE